MRTLLIVLVLLLASTAALAQDREPEPGSETEAEAEAEAETEAVPAPPATPATDTEVPPSFARPPPRSDDDDIGHIPYGNIIAFGPINLIASEAIVEYERRVDSDTSWYAQTAFQFGGSLIDDSSITIRFAAGARYYVAGYAPEGLFVAAELLFSYSEEEDDSIFYSTASVITSVQLGFTWHWFDRVPFSMALGVGHRTASTRSTTTQSGESGLAPAGKIMFGVAF